MCLSCDVAYASRAQKFFGSSQSDQVWPYLTSISRLLLLEAFRYSLAPQKHALHTLWAFYSFKVVLLPSSSFTTMRKTTKWTHHWPTFTIRVHKILIIFNVCIGFFQLLFGYASSFLDYPLKKSILYTKRSIWFSFSILCSGQDKNQVQFFMWKSKKVYGFLFFCFYRLLQGFAHSIVDDSTLDLCISSTSDDPFSFDQQIWLETFGASIHFWPLQRITAVI